MIYVPGEEDRQLAALRQRVAQLQLDREVYVRLCIVLCRYLSGEVGDIPWSEDGESVMVPKSWLDAIPGRWRVDLSVGEAVDAEDEDAEPREMVAIRVSKVEEGNGSVVVPDRMPLDFGPGGVSRE